MVNKGDFIELEYTGRFAENNKVFDTTNIDIAKNNNIHNPKVKYGPVIVCVGQSMLVPGLEKDILDNKEVGKEHTVIIAPENAFGKKDPKNLRLVPLKVFKDKNITPHPGLQLQIGESVATVKTVAGGRCIVDFNNPLSGHEVSYNYKIVSIVNDSKMKVKSIFQTMYGIEVKPEDKEGKISVKLPDIVPQEIMDAVIKKVKDVAGVDLIIEKEKIVSVNNKQTQQ